MPSKYKPTGYKPGRPRKGEIRPVTKTGLQSAKWRANNYERALELGRISSVMFRLENYEREREICRNYRIRRKAWAGIKISVDEEGIIELSNDSNITFYYHVQIDE